MFFTLEKNSFYFSDKNFVVFFQKKKTQKFSANKKEKEGKGKGKGKGWGVKEKGNRAWEKRGFPLRYFLHTNFAQSNFWSQIFAVFGFLIFSKFKNLKKNKKILKLKELKI